MKQYCSNYANKRLMLESVLKVFQRLIMWKCGIIFEEEFLRLDLNEEERSVAWLTERFVDKLGLRDVELAGDLRDFSHVQEDTLREMCVKFKGYFVRSD